jgi:hypothetical protein
MKTIELRGLEEALLVHALLEPLHRSPVGEGPEAAGAADVVLVEDGDIFATGFGKGTVAGTATVTATIGGSISIPLSVTMLVGAPSVANSSFTANWTAVSGATGYSLDVSTVSDFSRYIGGYRKLDVGKVTSWSVTGLSANKTYYYRVRAYDSSRMSDNSNVITVTTAKN